MRSECGHTDIVLGINCAWRFLSCTTGKRWVFMVKGLLLEMKRVHLPRIKMGNSKAISPHELVRETLVTDACIVRNLVILLYMSMELRGAIKTGVTQTKIEN